MNDDELREYLDQSEDGPWTKANLMKAQMERELLARPAPYLTEWQIRYYVCNKLEQISLGVKAKHVEDPW